MVDHWEAIWNCAPYRIELELMSTSSDIDGGADGRRLQARRIFALGLMGLAGAMVNLIFAFSLMPRFALIFHDMLPESQVPWTAQVVLEGKWVFVALALFWPLVALSVIKFARRDTRRSGWQLIMIACGILIQFLIPSGIMFSVLWRIVRHLDGNG